MYMIKHMAKGPCREVKEAIDRSSGDKHSVDPEKLRSEIEKLLPEALLKDNLPAFVQAFRNQLKFPKSSRSVVTTVQNCVLAVECFSCTTIKSIEYGEILSAETHTR